MPAARGWRRLLLGLWLCGAIGGSDHLHAQNDTAGDPTGTDGATSGLVTTAGSYDVYNGNVKRVVTDLVVPGSAGTLPLAFSRTYNSRYNPNSGRLGDAGWRHSYQWAGGISTNSNGATVYTIYYPDGGVVNFRYGRSTAPPGETFARGQVGTSDRLEVAPSWDPNHSYLHLSDGTQVQFGVGNQFGGASELIDVNGAVTTLTYGTYTARETPQGPTYAVPELTRVTDPAGRALVFGYRDYYYNGTNGNTIADHWVELASVTYQGAQTTDPNNPTLGVVYNYTPYQYQASSQGGNNTVYCALTSVTYPETSTAGGAVQAHYTYAASNIGVTGSGLDDSTSYGAPPLLITADDPHFAGPMSRIHYVYNSTTNVGIWGLVQAEENLTNGDNVSLLTQNNLGAPTYATDTRGDAADANGTGIYRGFFFGQGGVNGGTATNALPFQLTTVTSFGTQSAPGGSTFLTYNPAGSANGQGYVASSTDATNVTTQYATEPLAGKVKKVTYADGLTRKTTWAGVDPSTNEQSLTAKNPYFITSTTDERGNTTSYVRYGNTGFLSEIDYPDGGSEYYPSYQQFVVNGNAFYKATLYQNKLGGQTVYAYDETDTSHGGSGHVGLLTSVTRKYAVGSQIASERTAFFYDSLDRVRKSVDPRNVTTTYLYDNRHHLTQLTHAADNTSVVYKYDDYGNRLSVQDELTHTTTATYDEYHRPTSMTVPVSSSSTRTTTTTYERRDNGNNTLGDALSTTSTAFSYQVLPSGRATRRVYSPNGWLTDEYAGQTTGSGSSLSFSSSPLHDQAGLTYDAAGRLLQRTDAQGKSWQKGYDGYGRPSSATDPLGHVTGTTYYASGSTYAGLVETAITPGQDASNEQDTLTTTYTAYDLMARPTNWSNPSNAFVSGYDAAGNLSSQSDGAPTTGSGAHPATQYAYDQLGRKSKITYADSTYQQWTYDASGNPASYTNRAGAKQTYSTYDQRNHFAGYSWSDGTTGATGVVIDAVGRPTQIANANSQLTIGYDWSGALLTEQELLASGGTNDTVSYTYDQDGNAKNVTYPGGEVASWPNRDFMGRITQTNSSAASVVLASYAYTGSWLENRLTGGGVTTAYGYQDNGRISVVNQYCGSTDISYRQYGYYPDGQMSWFKKAAIGGGSALENGAGDAYYYQGDGSLVFTYGEAQNPGTYSANGDTNPNGVNTWARVCNYGYDQAGNRTTDSESGTAHPAAFDNEDRYNGLAYNDRNGEVTDMHNGAPVFHYTYDAENRLLNAVNTVTGATVASFAYDPLGRLCARTVNGVTSRLYYAGSQLVEERDGSNAKVHTFYYGAGGERVCMLVAKYGGAAVFYHYDARGFVTHLTNYNGTVVEQYLYDAWGTPYVYNGAGTTSYGQTSQVETNRYLWGSDYEWYPEIGLYRCGARFYSPVYALWMQPDPIGQAGGLNIYGYCGNDPINLTDPSGLWTWAGVWDSIVQSIGLGDTSSPSSSNTPQGSGNGQSKDNEGYYDSNGNYVERVVITGSNPPPPQPTPPPPTSNVYIYTKPIDGIPLAVHSYIQYDSNGSTQTINGGPSGKGAGRLMGSSFHNGNVKDAKDNATPLDWSADGYSSEQDFIKDLEGAEAAYKENLAYNPFSWAGGDGYNSNGYTHGIVNSVMGQYGAPQSPSAWALGWNPAVPIGYTPQYQTTPPATPSGPPHP